MLTASQLTRSLVTVASVRADKRANAFTSPVDEPIDNAALQEIVGDPDTEPLSWSVQYKPSTGLNESNPNNPVVDDLVFWSGMFEGSRLMDNDGNYWDLEEYGLQGGVVLLRDPWHPRTTVSCSVSTLRKSIHSWVEPFLQRVPPPPIGVDYGTVSVKVAE